MKARESLSLVITALLIVSVVIGVTSCPEVVQVLLRVEQPQFDPGAGNFNDEVDVTVTCKTEGASIRYTTDGSTPTSTEGTVYAAPVHVTSTTTIKAIAYKEGQLDSEVVSGTYSKNVDEVLLRVEQPQFDPGAGNFDDEVDVTVTCKTEGASIRYTTDGSTPTSTEGTVYAAPIHVTSTTTIKAIAYKEGQLDSEVASGTYSNNVLPQVYQVTFSPMINAFYNTAQDVTMSCGTAGAQIRYTTDGSVPTSSTGTI